MTSFFVAAGEPSSLPNQNYTLDERKLMADILYEDLNNQRGKKCYIILKTVPTCLIVSVLNGVSCFRYAIKTYSFKLMHKTTNLFRKLI